MFAAKRCFHCRLSHPLKAPYAKSKTINTKNIEANTLYNDVFFSKSFGIVLNSGELILATNQTQDKTAPIIANDMNHGIGFPNVPGGCVGSINQNPHRATFPIRDITNNIFISGENEGT